jgi:hypothetical protein
VGLLLRGEVWGLSLHDAIFNDEMEIRYYFFSFKFTYSQLDIQYGYARAVVRRRGVP